MRDDACLLRENVLSLKAVIAYFMGNLFGSMTQAHNSLRF
jgi:hypothetical protein